MSKVVLRVRGDPVIEEADGSVHFKGGLTIDSDGSPRSYAPPGKGLAPLDYLANAGHTGNWWGIVTVNGVPHIQGPSDPFPGYYVSTTSYERREFKRTDPRRYLDSEKVPFIVVPGPLRRMVKGIVLGCRAVVVDLKNGREISAIVGDTGPAGHLGEASIAVANFFGVNPSPKHGGTNEERFLYTVFPGQQATINGERFSLIPA